MFVDASAWLAIHLAEPEAERLATAIEHATVRYISPLVVFETALGFAKQKRMPLIAAKEFVERSAEESNFQVIAITAEIGAIAVQAHEKYGKGRGHKAQLNMGDCFAYACAKSLGVPLLYKGDDFTRTDLA